MTADRGLEVVIPRRFDRRRIPALVESKRVWIERASARGEARRQELEANPPRLPERIALPLVSEEWRVEYRAKELGAWGTVEAGAAVGRGGATVRERAGRLVVTGDVADSAACRDALCRWLRRKAKATLVPRLAEVSQEHRLGYERASVRQQKSRWGSCSRRGTISLNANLLFLSAPLVDYVLLHELCHTVEMNHSPRFWTLLGYHDPDCKAHRKALRQARTSLPAWVEHDIEEPAL
jgi:predicted metal-dependent hydrolase